MPGLLRLPRLLLGTFTAAALALAFHGAAIPNTAAFTNCYVADTSLDAEEQAFLGLINAYRAQYGLAPLSVSENLNRSATWMAQDMATKGYFAHRDSSGRDPFTRIADCGGTTSSGENLAAGPMLDSARAAFDLWQRSPAHDRNMRNGSYVQIGIARAYNGGTWYGWYWVTTFSTVNVGGALSVRPPAAPLNVGVTMLNPAPGARLPGSSVTFWWSAGVGVQEYWLEVGTTPGGKDLVDRSTGLALLTPVDNLPVKQPVYARLWYRVNGQWHFDDYAYEPAEWW